MTPATATSVRTYGSASNSVETEVEYSCRIVGEGAREAEQETGDRGAERPPVPEDERGEGDEPAPGGHVGVERVHEAEREVRAAGRGEHAGDDHRAVAVTRRR